jgi:FixJ family two-component response regulator
VLSPVSCVTVIEDDPLLLRSITRVLQTSGFHVAPYQSAAEFLYEADHASPGCLLVEMSMPELDGLALQRALSEASDPRPIVFMSGEADIDCAVAALKAGASDFLTKPVDETKLVHAIREAVDGERVARDRRAAREAWEARLDGLTRRERQVLHGVVEGRLNKQIAIRLGIAEKTVKVHRARMMAKLGVSSVAELVRSWLAFEASQRRPARRA